MKKHTVSIEKYSELIDIIPVYNQSAKVRRNIWEKFAYHNKNEIENAIFGTEKVIELTREDVLNETDTAKKIVMALMWGFPSGGRGNNVRNVLVEIQKLTKLLPSYENQNLTKIEAKKLIKEFNTIRGLGISTWTKLLFFFNISIDSKKCQIYDEKIVESLNKKQFYELGTEKWRQSDNHYYKYIELVDDLAKKTCTMPEQVELFLYYYNLAYRF